MDRSKTQNQLISISHIHAINNVPLSINGKLIPKNREIYNQKNASLSNSVAFDVSRQIPAKLMVTLSNRLDETKYLILEGLVKNQVLFSGKIRNNSGVEVACTVNPGAFKCCEGENIDWQLNDTSTKPYKVGSSQLDIYWINLVQVPKDLMRKGTPLEYIKSIKFKKKTNIFDVVSGPSVNTVPFLVNSVFNYVPPRYDIWSGANHFTTINGWNNITLHYTAYVYAHSYYPNAILNCYDAAAIIQYSLQYNGYGTYYCYMNPFGYLRQSNLIGRGSCNNPFYGSSGGPSVIDRQNNARTAFANHAFVYLLYNQTIVDACAGPHIGNEYAGTYVNNATDDIYPNPPKVQRGTTANIGYYTGVTSVNLIKSVRKLFKTPYLRVLKTMIAFDQNVVKRSANKIISGAWEHPMNHKGLKDWSSVYEEIVPGNEEVLKLMILKNKEHSLMFKLYVSSTNNKLAFNRFLTLASLSQYTNFPFENVLESSGHYAVINTNKGNAQFIGVYHNAVLNIQTSDEDFDLVELAKWYFNWSKGQLTSDIDNSLPKTSFKVNYSKDGHLNVSLENSENTILEFTDTLEKARLISSEEQEFTLDSIKSSIKKLRCSVIDKNTLLVRSHDIILKQYR